MTQTDKEIFKLFSDIRAVEETISGSFTFYPDLKKLHTESLRLFNEKSYSNIDVQDAKGNTFFHYVIDAGKYDIAKTIVSRGGNPFIKNNEGKNGFHLYGAKTRASGFLNAYEGISLYDKFNDKTKGFCTEFKQLVFDLNARIPNSFKEMRDIKDYLISVNLNTSNNRLKLLQNSISLDKEEKIIIYENNFNNKKSNSSFLKYLSSGVDNLKCMASISDHFYDRKFQDNIDFESTLSAVIYEADNAKDKNYCIQVAKNLIQVMLKQNFNLKKTINFKESLEKHLLNHDLLGKVYLNEKINIQLNEKIENKPKGFKI